MTTQSRAYCFCIYTIAYIYYLKSNKCDCFGGTNIKPIMANNYYDPKDLRKFGEITQWSEELGNKFFDYYGKVFEEGALTAREKSLIALAVAHTEQCPYCIDAYTKDGLQRGITKEEMMEAVHVGAAIKSGATLVHGVQMMNKVNKLEM